MYNHGAFRWPMGHLSDHLSALLLLVLLLACTGRASTVATVTLSTTPQQNTTTDRVVATQLTMLQTTGILSSSLGSTTPQPPGSTTQHLPTSTATSQPPTTPANEETSLSSDHTTLMGSTPPVVESSSEPLSVGSDGTGATAGGTQVVVTSNPSTALSTTAVPSSVTLTIIEWFLLAVAVAAVLFFAFLFCRCWQMSRRRKAQGHSDHNKNDIEYSTPKSPKERWRNSWALEAMVYHIELPQETDAEMEARENPVFEEDETEAAKTSHQQSHLTKL